MLAKTPSLTNLFMQSAHILFIIVQLMKLITISIPGNVPKTRASVAAAALTVYLSLLLAVLSHFEHIRSFRPSILLSVYFGLSTVFDGITSRTIWGLSDNIVYNTIFFINVGLRFCLFMAESLEKGSLPEYAKEKPAPETVGNVFTRSFFWWINPLLKLGFGHNLETKSLPVIDNELSSTERYARVWARWIHSKHPRPRNLTRYSQGRQRLLELQWCWSSFYSGSTGGHSSLVYFLDFAIPGSHSRNRS